MQYYDIVRFYQKRNNRRHEIIRSGLTLEKAQEWCNKEDTRKEGAWFDGYAKAGTY